MSLWLYHAHTGQKLPAIPLAEKVSTLKELRARIQRLASIPANSQTLLTGQGKDVDVDLLASGSGEIFVYDMRVTTDEHSPLLPSTTEVTTRSELSNQQRITAEFPIRSDDVQTITSWEDLMKSIRPWTEGILHRLTSIGQSILQQQNQASVISHGIIIALENLNQQFMGYSKRYHRLREDGKHLLPEKTSVIKNWLVFLNALESIHVRKDFRFLRAEKGIPRGPNTGSLIDYVDKNNIQRTGPKLSGIFNASIARLEKLTEAYDKLKDDVDRINAVNLTSPDQNDVDRILMRLRRYIDNALDNSQLNPSGDIPSSDELLEHFTRIHASLCGEQGLLETTFQSLQEALHSSLQKTGAAQKTSVEVTRNMSTIAPQIRNLTIELSELAAEGDCFDIVNQAFIAPTFYGAFLIEAVRRQEWGDRSHVIIRQRRTEISVACEKESQRRRQWTQNMGSVLSSPAANEATKVSLTELGLPESKDMQKWPTATEKDVKDYITQLERKGMSQAVKDLNEFLLETPVRALPRNDNHKTSDESIHDELGIKTAMTNPLDAPTTGAGDGVKEESISSLQRENARLGKESKGLKAQLQKLELLLHKQQPFTPYLYHRGAVHAGTEPKDEIMNQMSRRIGELESQLQKATNVLPTERGSSAQSSMSNMGETTDLETRREDDNRRPPSRLNTFTDESEIRSQVLMEYRKHGDNVQELTQLIERLSEEGQKWRKEAQSHQTEKRALFERATSLETERNELEKKTKSQGVEILDTKNALVEEKARTAVHLADSERLKHRIIELEERNRRHESNEEEDRKLSSLQKELEDAHSHSETMRAKLSTSEENDQTLKTGLNKRGVRASMVSEQLYSQIEQLGQLAEFLGFSIVRQDKDGQISVRRTSKVKQSASSDGDVEGVTIVPAIERADSIRWSQEADEDAEAATFESFSANVKSFPLDTFCKSITKRIRDIEGLARKYQKDTASYREKCRRTQIEAYNKIAFRGFREGDLALFLPTHNLVARSWAAFNVGEPHYFLKEQSSHRLSKREWLLARITNITEKVVDMSKGISHYQSDSRLLPTTPFAANDRSRPESFGSVAESSGSTTSSVYDEDKNPFGLPDGMKWYLVEASEEKAGAPSTPRGPGKTTVAPACVDVSGDMQVRRSEQTSDNPKTGKEKKRSGIVTSLSRELSLARDSSASGMSSRETSRSGQVETSSDKRKEASSPAAFSRGGKGEN